MITLHLPKRTYFDLAKEIAVVKNIKDSINRKNTTKGLRIIQQFLSKNRNHEGLSLYWDDNKLMVEPYNRNTKEYYCGRELKRIKKSKKVKFNFVVVDLTECFCAKIYDDGEIEKIFQITSAVGNKHRQGGQSSQRFARIREQQIITYFKRINDNLKKLRGDFIIGVNFIYRAKLEHYLSSEVKQKLLRWVTTEYGGISGVSQFRNANI